MKQIEYLGCFFDPYVVQSIPVNDRQGPLHRTIAVPHVTFSYNPSEVPGEWFGATVTVKVVGYGCDGKNEALLVELVELPPALQDLASKIQTPHITLSVAKLAKPFDSRYLVFTPIEPYILTGSFGGMDVEGTIHTEAF